MNYVRASFLLLFLTPVIYAAPVEDSSGTLDVRLTDMHGTVQLITTDGKAKGPLPVDMPFALAEGDFIKTGSSSTLEIAFPSGTLIHLAPNSALRLKQLSDAMVELALRTGILLAKVHFEKDEGVEFRVVTPSAVATVRGTEFVVEESSFGARVAVLDEGHVAVTAPGFKKEVVMHFNQETQVRRGLSPQNAHVLERLYHHKIEMSQMRTRTRVVRKNWKLSEPEELQHIRAAWITQNTPVPHAAGRHSHHTSQ